MRPERTNEERLGETRGDEERRKRRGRTRRDEEGWRRRLVPERFEALLGALGRFLSIVYAF